MAALTQVAHVPILLAFAPKVMRYATRGIGTTLPTGAKKVAITSLAPKKMLTNTRGYGTALPVRAIQYRIPKPFYWS